MQHVAGKKFCAHNKTFSKTVATRNPVTYPLLCADLYCHYAAHDKHSSCHQSDRLQFLVISFLSSRQVSNTMIISTLWACLLTLTPKPVFPVACFLYLWCTHSTAYNGTERKSLFKTTLTSGHCQVLQTGIQADTSSFTQLKVKLSLTVL